MNTLFDDIHEASSFIRTQIPNLNTRVAIVLGSGLGHLAAEIQDSVTLPYIKIPHFAVSTIPGHTGRLVVGNLSGHPVVVMQGRLHFSEGYDMSVVTFPVRVLKALGVKTLILTNAAGGLNPRYKPGDLMGIQDHIFLPGLAGHNPLRGPNDERLGPRFPAISGVYTGDFLNLAEVEAKKLGLTFHRGVYIMVSGPNFESPAELRFLRTIGGDAVGMSTVPETIVAAHSGMRVLGISTITNSATGENNEKASHEEVLAVGQQAGAGLSLLIKNLLPLITSP